MHLYRVNRARNPSRSGGLNPLQSGPFYLCILPQSTDMLGISWSTELRAQREHPLRFEGAEQKRV